MASSIVLKDRGVFHRTRSGNFIEEPESHEVSFNEGEENVDVIVGKNSREYAMDIPIDNTNHQ